MLVLKRKKGYPRVVPTIKWPDAGKEKPERGRQNTIQAQCNFDTRQASSTCWGIDLHDRDQCHSIGDQGSRRKEAVGGGGHRGRINLWVVKID